MAGSSCCTMCWVSKQRDVAFATGCGTLELQCMTSNPQSTDCVCPAAIPASSYSRESIGRLLCSLKVNSSTTMSGSFASCSSQWRIEGQQLPLEGS